MIEAEIVEGVMFDLGKGNRTNVSPLLYFARLHLPTSALTSGRVPCATWCHLHAPIIATTGIIVRLSLSMSMQKTWTRRYVPDAAPGRR